MTRRSEPTPTSAEGPVLEAVVRAIRPLVRLLVARGVLLPTVVAALKRVYVEVASAHFSLDGKPLTDSRISLLTGVHRRDVRSLRKADRLSTAPPPSPVGATVIGRWLGDPAFADAAGRPAPLPRAAEGDAPSFERLVASVITDIRPRTVLDELEDRGLVRHDPATDRVSLEVAAYVPRGDDPELLRFYAMNLHDHAAVATRNLLGAGAPGLERAVYYNRLRPASVQALEAAAREEAGRLLETINARALALQEADSEADSEGGEATMRMRFGVYFHAATEPPDQEPPSEKAGTPP